MPCAVLTSWLVKPGVSAGASCNACRVRGFVRSPGVTGTVPGHEDRLRAGVHRDQNPSAQRDALAAAGCDQVFIDKASGTLTLARRPEGSRQGSSCWAAAVSSSSISACATRVSAATSIDRAKT
jgi:hypothetical protein